MEKNKIKKVEERRLEKDVKVDDRKRENGKP